MKKFSEKAKAFVMAAAMVVVLLLPMKINAQTKMDGFFDTSFSSNYEDRLSDWEVAIINQQFGTNLEPLGSGLIILSLAGAGYAFLKKKED